MLVNNNKKNMLDTSYYTIQGWMKNQLGLRGAMLNVYALIHGFSSDGKGSYRGSYTDISNTLDISPRTVGECIRKLSEAQLIIVGDQNHSLSSWKVNVAKIATEGGKNCQGGVAKIATEGGKNCQEGVAKIASTLYNYNGNNIINNIYRTFPPKIEDIKSYVEDKKIEMDVEKFYLFYEQNGWMVGKNKMKNWSMAIQLWARNNWAPVKNLQNNKQIVRFNSK